MSSPQTNRRGTRVGALLLAIVTLGTGYAVWAGMEIAPASIGGSAPGPRAEVSIDALRGHLHYLASDELGGRSAGSAGYDAAATFVEDELRAYGVAPLFPGDDGAATSYRQPFELATWDVAPGGGLTIRRSGETDELALLRDLQIAYVRDDAIWRGALPVVYVGAGFVEPDLGYDDLVGLDIDGACVAIFFDVPQNAFRGAPAALRERNPQGNDGLVRRLGHAARRGAACALVIAGPAGPPFWAPFLTDANQLTSQTTSPADSAALLGIAAGISDRGATRLFAGQPRNPVVDGTLEPFALDGVRVEFDLDLRSAVTLGTHNVGGLIAGTDPSLDDQIIVLSAHLDGQGTRADGVVLNSANDNGSSVVALLEAARLLAETPARRPVALLFTTGEESGLVGVEQFVDHPPVDFSRIALNVNMEMVGKRRTSGPTYEFRVAGRHADAIETLVGSTRRHHGNVDFDYERRFETPAYQFRRADHAHFFLRGVPTIYFYGGGEDYHQPSDDPDRVVYPKVQTMAEVLFALIRVTDTLDELPRSDGRS
jgi:hypothetical protein